MMTKTKTSVRGRIKFLWTLPVLVLLLFAFAEPDYKAKDIEPQLKEISTQEVFSEKTLTISGKVVMKETGEPLPGATVVIKGSTVGTVVDRDGTFKLVDPNPEIENDGEFLSTTIVISFVGLRTIETKLGASQKNLEKQGQVNGTIKMEEAVIVIGTDIPPPPPPKTKPEKPVPPPPPPPPAKGEKEVFYIVEDMPKYPGGYEALDDYISKMQKKIAVSKKVKGKAKVAFTVNNKGKITDIKVVESDNDAAAKGAVMIASAMPEWTPGKQRGKPVQVKYLLPVEFK